MRACPPGTFLNEQRKANDPSPQSSCLAVPSPFGQAYHPTSAWSPITAVSSPLHSNFRGGTPVIVVSHVSTCFAQESCSGTSPSPLLIFDPSATEGFVSQRSIHR